MNVTIKISDDLGKEARHRAVDAGLSLSGWVADVIRKELSQSPPSDPRTLLEALGYAELADFEIEFPRDSGGIRKIDFQ